jgi:gentisate 1,2-dioxygenase
VIVCFRGEGASIVDGTRITWSAGDMISVPSWAPLDHEAGSAADLFVISDAPVLEALHIARTETVQAQEISAEFTAGAAVAAGQG